MNSDVTCEITNTRRTFCNLTADCSSSFSEKKMYDLVNDRFSSASISKWKIKEDFRRVLLLVFNFEKKRNTVQVHKKCEEAVKKPSNYGKPNRQSSIEN